MGRSYPRGRIPSARTLRRAKRPRAARLPRADRKALLLGTALASTLLFASLLAPPSAHAVTNCLIGNPPPGPITTVVNDDIVCINADDRNNVGSVITLAANGGNNYIYLNNSGDLAATTVGGDAIGIIAFTNNGLSPIDIINSGDVTANATGANGDAYGIIAFTNNGLSPISLVNSGAIAASTAGANAELAFISCRSSSPRRRTSGTPPTRPGSTAPPTCACCSMAARCLAPRAASSGRRASH